MSDLRRDGAPLRVGSVRHFHDGAAHSGIRVREEVHLILEPLDPAALLTVRCTTPVVSIEELLDEDGDDE